MLASYQAFISDYTNASKVARAAATGGAGAKTGGTFKPARLMTQTLGGDVVPGPDEFGVNGRREMKPFLGQHSAAYSIPCSAISYRTLQQSRVPYIR